jgi:hypothetical protein
VAHPPWHIKIHVKNYMSFTTDKMSTEYLQSNFLLETKGKPCISDGGGGAPVNVEGPGQTCFNGADND